MAPNSVPQQPIGRDRAIGNFSAGPACLSDWVMRTAGAEFCNKDNTGMGILENRSHARILLSLRTAQMSHRDAGGPVQNAISSATDKLRIMLDVPTNYHILFLQGGAHGQFAAIALNLLGDKTQADYVSTGYWSQRAISEASKYCTVRLAYDGAKDGFQSIPPVSEWDISPDSAYVHICANETIHGLEFLEDPELPEGSPVLVGDFTSTLMSRRINISKYGCIYASGGKNLGPAGVVAVIVRDDLLNRALPTCPSVLSYSVMASSKPIPSIYNTPPTFLIYMVDLVLKDNMNNGGIEALERRAIERARRIYDVVEDSNGFYTLKCQDAMHRSRMNVPFRIGKGSVDMEELFCVEGAQRGLLQLFCHPLFPGCRITLYNGIPDSAVDALVEHMVDFQTKYMHDVVVA
ncbi:Phosphoserine transaminase [Gracilaria domingensis]|nr:Phosphoserine transaminase [Gracilaria domingensis]